MSRLWYPKIEESKCIKCGTCVSNCKKGVYDKDKYPEPFIIAKDNCSEGCHGCSMKCPTEAITYVDLRN